MAEKIITTEYSEEMQRSYMNYSMSVITARAIPDARDGLKPVQRRVLYDMSELKLGHDKPHRKSARIVGDTMGKYHPHGDSSIYETLVVMSQDFKKGMALVDGHGNFGSIEGDGAAAMRYTEARLKKFAEETQFIVITHRRGTMAAADRLYGITMQEKGVSTLVSVNLIDDDLSN